MKPALLAALIAPVAFAAAGDDYARLEGHGGPVRGVSVAEDGAALTASFDNAVGVWSIDPPRHVRWLDGHAAAVNAVLPLPGERALSVGDDFDAILWDLRSGEDLRRLTGHQGKVMAAALSPDGGTIATASWDGRIGLWALDEGGAPRWIEAGHGAMNDVSFSADGATLYAAAADGTVGVFDTATGEERAPLAAHGFGVNRIALNRAAGWLAYGAVDGGTRAVDLATGETLADLTLERRPILALALSPDGDRLAVGDGEGYVMVVDTASWTIERDFRAALRGPVWALAFTPDGRRLIAGGLDEAAAIWPLDGATEAVLATDGTPDYHRDPATMSNGERQFMRKCSICHSLTAEADRRAGPTLRAVFGRKAGEVAGYVYSEALDSSEIVWSADTIDALFDEGPARYVPGTKMPMQRIVDPQDRADLVAFLREATRP